MKTLLCMGLLLALFSPGAPLQCMTCQYDANNRCISREPRFCPGNTCRDVVLSDELFDDRTYRFSDCVNTEDCTPGVFAFGAMNTGNFIMKAECCYTDLCNEKAPKILWENRITFFCAACCANPYSREIDTCWRRNDDLYKGRRCLTLLTDIKNARGKQVRLGSKGCATPDFCNFLTTAPKGVLKALNRWFFFEVKRAKCYDPNVNWGPSLKGIEEINNHPETHKISEGLEDL